MPRAHIIAGLVPSIAIIVQGITARSFPPYLFETWKPGAYKEKLEWNAFRHHLSDLAQLGKYSNARLAV